MLVTVVNMIPGTLSGESQRDSEPNLAVDPSNPQHMAGSAFTPDPAGSAFGPIFVSQDGGATWRINVIVPGGSRTGDITIRFGGSSGVLYAGILRFDDGNLNILRSANFTGPTAMTVLVDRANDDQPYVEATTVLRGTGTGNDRVYVPSNDTSQRKTTGRTASIDQSFDAATAAPPAGFTTTARIETRATAALPSMAGNQDGPSVRVAIHPQGRIYGLYFGWRTFGTTTNTSDIVVVRDDNWGQGATPYAAISDTDGNAGVRVATGLTLPSLSTLLGTQRIGSNNAIAVDPRNADTVYIAWCEGATAATYTLHVRRSTSGGGAGTWSGDLKTVTGATNPGLAINSKGRVALLYQQLVAVGGANRWRTHVELTDDAFSHTTDLMLADVPDANGTYTGSNPIGDYAGILAIGKDFHGVFAANNTPNNANFPNGVTYQRFADFGSQQLFANVQHTIAVPISIDPFYFRVADVVPRDDFYVRDWTDSPTSGDSGVEPSTHSVFWATSDVWNRRGTLPGSFSQDQPENEAAGNGTGAVGNNWAFARIRRNVAGGPAQTVSAHFLVSKLGTGSSFVDAGTMDPDVAFPDPDPTVVFNSGDVGPFVTTPFAWHLNAVVSTHLCLAVEISTPNDPVAPPSLVGRAPGWPTTDLAVLFDNNKAQRNMGLSTTPARGVGLSDSLWAIAHNAATFRRDLVLRIADPYNGSERLRRLRVEVLGEKPRAIKEGATIVLSDMAPGENRWVGLTFEPPSGKTGEAFPLHFEEVVDGITINGFGLGPQLAPPDEVAASNLRLHASIARRLDAGFGVPLAAQEALRAQELLEGRLTSNRYVAAVLAGARLLASAVPDLLREHGSGDEFRVATALRRVAKLASQGLAPEVMVAHHDALERFDAQLTQLQLAAGDPADVLLTVRWERDVYERSAKLSRLACASEVIDACDRFIDAYSRREATNADYPGLLESLADCHEATSSALRARRGAIERQLTGLLANRDGAIGALQGAHAALVGSLDSIS